MDEDPFASPLVEVDAPIDAPAGAIPIAAHEFSVREIFAIGWQVFLRRPWLIIAPFLLVKAPTTVLGAYFLRQGELSLSLMLGLGLLAASLAVLPAVSLAYTTDRLIEGREPVLGEVLRYGLRHWPRVVVASLIPSLTLIVGAAIVTSVWPAAVDNIRSEGGSAASIITALLVMFCSIPGFIFSVRFRFTTITAALRVAGPFRALRYSWNLVRGRWWRCSIFVAIETGVVELGSNLINGALERISLSPALRLSIGTLAHTMFDLGVLPVSVAAVVLFLNLEAVRPPIGAALDRRIV